MNKIKKSIIILFVVSLASVTVAQAYQSLTILKKKEVQEIPSASGLLVTSSVEDTTDEINDGAILGRFIGILPFDKMGKLSDSHGVDFKVLQH